MQKKWIGYGAIAAFLLVVSLALTVEALTPKLPTFEQVKEAHMPSDAWLLSREGTTLQQMRIDSHGRRLEWTSLEEVSPALLRAIIYSEDRSFYSHSGVDWNAVAASAWRNLWNTRTRGASTLTMQLAGLFNTEAQSGRRTLGEKIRQVLSARAIEQTWGKDQILEAYLNRVSFRGELQGVAAMSATLFGKLPDGLDLREAAIAAVLLRSPEAAGTTVAARACRLLEDQGHGDHCVATRVLATRVLKPPYRFDMKSEAPHLARHLLSVPGERLRTTLSADLQREARTALRHHLLQLSGRNVADGAVLVLDNASGDVLAWVGGSGADLSQAHEVDAATAPRQAGSTLKPFLYAEAIERHYLTASSILDDSPLDLPTPTGLYAPQNYDRTFHGPVSVRSALGASLNIPAVRTLLLLGADRFRDDLESFGFAGLTHDGDFYGYSLALGSAEVSLLELANAYRVLANGGIWSPVNLTSSAQSTEQPGKKYGLQQAAFTEQAQQTRQVIGPAAAFIVTDILADNNARARTFGLSSILTTPYWTAVKTGTSKDMRDNWCIGFSRRYTVAVWVGNASGAPMHDVSGSSGAAPVWREIMDHLHRYRAGSRQTLSSQPPPPPPDIARKKIRFEPAIESRRNEWFIAGTEQPVVVMSGNQAGARIVYPPAGSIIALDPDIPHAQQRVHFSAAGVRAGWRWLLDGKPFAEADREVSWFPEPGDHWLTLEGPRGDQIDEVDFSVRGTASNSR